MSEETIRLDEALLDPKRLFSLLPRRIPARVKTVLGDPTTGFVHVLIPALYPDGQPIDDIYCKNLHGAIPGDEVLVEWEEAPPSQRRRRDQPDLIQGLEALHVKSDEVEQAVQQYEEYIGAEIQQDLLRTLQMLEKERESVADRVETQVAATLATRRSELDAYRGQLDKREEALTRQDTELRAKEAALTGKVSQLVEQRLAARKAELDRREENLARQEAELQSGKAALDETVSRRVKEQVVERNLELEQREAILEKREEQLQARQSELQDQKLSLETRWAKLIDERARFETEGGQAYMEHIAAIEEQNAATSAPSIQASAEPFNPAELSVKLAERGYQIAPNLLSQAVIATIAAWSSGQFVILAGPTGVGKTQLVRQLAGALGAGHGLVSVRPGWVDPADLFGFFNPMHRLFEPAPAIDRLVKAAKYTEADRLYALCLDEMNLSRVENYAADVLSKLEMVVAGEQPIIDLYSVDIARRLHDEQERLLQSQSKLEPREAAYLYALTRQLQLYPSVFGIARGLVIFGTVNVDETTQMFSPKFLDRAYVLRFPPVTLPKAMNQLPFAGGTSGALWPLTITKAQQLLSVEKMPRKINAIWRTFVDWQSSYLNPLGLHLGHRFYASFLRYISVGLNLGFKDHTSLADGYFLAKIPPRIRFGPDERAIGQAETTKTEVLQAWIERDQSLQAYKQLRTSLAEMVERSEARGMVEYWD